jgi:hypothetical protein
MHSPRVGLVMPVTGAFLYRFCGLNKLIEPIRMLVLYPHELAVTHSTFSAFFGTFYPAIIRGEAYLASHKAAEAVTEFRQILNQPGLLLGDPVGAMAQLQLARAYAMQGDTASAKTAYQDFLTLWERRRSRYPSP